MKGFGLHRRIKVLVDKERDIPFVMRIYAPGEQLFPGDVSRSDVKNTYEGWCVQFYDGRYDHTDLGQFTGGSYYASTLLETKAERGGGYGINLHGGVPDWTICAYTFQKFLKHLIDFLDAYDEACAEEALEAYIGDD